MSETKTENIIDVGKVNILTKPVRNKGGRPKGTTNKSANYLRECVVSSFEKLGGVTWLVKLGQTDPKAYATLLAKTMPSIQAGDPENPIETKSTVIIDVSKLPDELLNRLGGAL